VRAGSLVAALSSQSKATTASVGDSAKNDAARVSVLRAIGTRSAFMNGKRRPVYCTVAVEGKYRVARSGAQRLSALPSTSRIQPADPSPSHQDLVNVASHTRPRSSIILLCAGVASFAAEPNETLTSGRQGPQRVGRHRARDGQEPDPTKKSSQSQHHQRSRDPHDLDL